MKTFTLCALLLLSACVTASPVVPAGDGKYLITARASGGLNAGKDVTEATRQAGDYCAARGMSMSTDHVVTNGNAAVFGENVQLYFTCIAAR